MRSDAFRDLDDLPLHLIGATIASAPVDDFVAMVGEASEKRR